jgi:hypothetical protein
MSPWLTRGSPPQTGCEQLACAKQPLATCPKSCLLAGVQRSRWTSLAGVELSPWLCVSNLLGKALGRHMQVVGSKLKLLLVCARFAIDYSDIVGITWSLALLTRVGQALCASALYQKAVLEAPHPHRWLQRKRCCSTSNFVMPFAHAFLCPLRCQLSFSCSSAFFAIAVQHASARSARMPPEPLVPKGPMHEHVCSHKAA